VRSGDGFRKITFLVGGPPALLDINLLGATADPLIEEFDCLREAIAPTRALAGLLVEDCCGAIEAADDFVERLFCAFQFADRKWRITLHRPAQGADPMRFNPPYELGIAPYHVE
jgi:hypothetical protein